MKEKPSKLELNSGRTHVIMKNPIEIIPAIIWFSVKLDVNIPNEIYDITNNKNPSIVANVVVSFGTPQWHKIPKYINVHNSVIITINSAAINLPNTIFFMLTGDVNSSCSVHVFLSSANDLIVSNGIINAKTSIVGNV